jgi:hypothetical protein
MPNMLQHESNNVVKALVASNSGTGKTGALASLVDAGYNLRVLDFDNGLSVLKGFVRDKSKLANVTYQTLRDELKLAGGRFNIHKASAFDKAMKILDKGGLEWGEGCEHIPPITEWTSSDILVIDTLGMMSRSCLFMVMALNGAGMKNPELQHYGQAMENIERMLAQLTSAAVGCNVLIHTHLYHSEDGMNIYAESLGSKLGPKVPRYFDNFFTISLTAGQRKFKTKKDGLLACKSAIPLDETYPIETGYAQIFAALLGRSVDKLVQA